MSECNNVSAALRLITALGAGAIVGAGVAILFAPHSGKETRDMLASKANEIEDTAGDVIERGKNIVNEVKHKASEAFEKGKEIAQATSEGKNTEG
ncbi:MAG: YtxH domain-containing protein [Phycisphaeraceae bacterium]|nr:YtxH domain-containing protein [Phycisphaeraceae bacterium]